MLYYTLKHIGEYGPSCDPRLGCKVVVIDTTEDATTIKASLIRQ